MYYSITLWGVPEPRVEPGTGEPEAETLTTRPPHLLSPHLMSTVKEVHLFWQSREGFHGPALNVFYKNCTVQYSTIQCLFTMVLYTVQFIQYHFCSKELWRSLCLHCYSLLYCTVYTTRMSEFEPVLPQSHYACAFVLLLKILHEMRKILERYRTFSNRLLNVQKQCLHSHPSIQYHAINHCTET